jgi:predicted ArsR family transcriptional regulator
MRKTTHADRLAEQIGAIAALADPTRRALYRFVVAQRESVSRDQAAAAVGVAHHTAKFHLDKLAKDGLLDAEYSRPAGRTGPGAGRPAKRYRRSAREVAVSVPERKYDLASRIMARAISTAIATGAPVADTLGESAALEGRELGERALARVDAQTTAHVGAQAVTDALAENGFEPYSENGITTLANCPFHAVARESPELVCGMNLGFIQALLATCEGAGLQAQLEPDPGRCCITLIPTEAAAPPTAQRRRRQAAAK